VLTSPRVSWRSSRIRSASPASIVSSSHLQTRLELQTSLKARAAVARRGPYAGANVLTDMRWSQRHVR